MAVFGKRKEFNASVEVDISPNRIMIENAAPGFFNPPDFDGEKLLRAIQEDPLLLAKKSADELKYNIYNLVKGDQGVRVETALFVLGSLGGYACLDQAIGKFTPETAKADPRSLIALTGKDGKRYFMGNLINDPLLTSNLSLSNLTMGMAQHLGGKNLPDVSELVGFVAETYGNHSFGKPRLPVDHNIGDVPFNFVKYMWPKIWPMFSNITRRQNQIPLIFGLAIQKVIEEAQQIIDPGMAAKIVMECAVPMAHINPDDVNGL
jgi:hypothetical protein